MLKQILQCRTYIVYFKRQIEEFLLYELSHVYNLTYDLTDLIVRVVFSTRQGYQIVISLCSDAQSFLSSIANSAFMFLKANAHVS